jgi:hypothetical protein
VGKWSSVDGGRPNPADIVHSALAEHVAAHRDDLARVYGETQALLQAGDLEGLAATLRKDAGRFAHEIAGEILRTGSARAKGTKPLPMT